MGHILRSNQTAKYIVKKQLQLEAYCFFVPEMKEKKIKNYFIITNS